MYSADGQKIPGTASEVHQEDNNFPAVLSKEPFGLASQRTGPRVLHPEVSHRGRILGTLQFL